MRHRHRVRRGAVLAAIVAVALSALVEPRPIEAQHGGQCLKEYTLESRTRRVTGSVMTECGGECPLPPPAPCHSAPWGNWGVTTRGWDTKENGDQFKGWRRIMGLWGHLSQWNSCTDQYYDYPYTNDGRGKQKASPDDEEITAYKSVKSALACAGSLPEVHTVRNLILDVYELDWDGSQLVTELRYGFFDVPITCSDAWNCYGESGWRQQLRVDSSGVSAEVKAIVETSFVSY